MTNCWIMNKIGLFDFWYYDEQEFYFSDGRMLLRGANGSGKSVTMQSFIPMILDGNTNPERIDPFGTKNRKIGGYLIEEDDERNERIGYLYMEFKRQNSETYYTIGLGIRAIKGKNIEKWYFCINDNRRVNKDIFLYTNKTEGKVSLSRRELENRIGEGGRVFLNRNDYATEVNRFLFGFTKVEHFKELTDLMIKLRTPKLSKDFKPSDLSNMLTAALKELGEDELRALSDVIENIDSIENKIEELENAKKEAEKIVGLYDCYNHKVLYDKAYQLLDAINEKIKLEGYKKNDEAELEKENKALFENKQALDAIKKEKISIEERLKIYNIDDIEKLKAEYDSLEEQRRECCNDLEDRENEEKKSVIKEKELELKAKSAKDEKDIKYNNFFAILKNLNETADYGSFVEHYDFENSFRGSYENSYDFTYISKTAEDRKLKADIAFKAFDDYNKYRDSFEEEERKLSTQQKERDYILNQINKNEDEQLKKANDKIDDINIWQSDNLELKLCNEDREKIVNYIYNIKEYNDIFRIEEIVNNTAIEYKNKIDENARASILEIKGLNETINSKKAELEKFISSKHCLELKKEVEESRKRLTEQGIEFLPFYEAVDFQENTEADKANEIEEALYEMGILDAIVINAKYKAYILENKEYFCDKFIFIDNENNNFNSFILPQENNLDLNKILFNKPNGDICINCEGVYSLGGITGIISGKYKAKFIGEERRKKYKEDIINALKTEIKDLEESIAYQENILKEGEGKKLTIDQEKSSFFNINLRELMELIGNKKSLEDKLKVLEEDIKEKSEQVKALQDKVIKLAAELKEMLKIINCDFNIEKVKDCKDAMSDYIDDIKNLELEHKNYIFQKDVEKSALNELEDIRYSLENIIRYKIAELKKRIERIDNKLEEHRKLFKEKGFEEQISIIEADKARKEELATTETKISNLIAVNESRINDYTEKINIDREKIEKANKIENYYHTIFWEEKKLCLTTFEPKEEENLFEFASRICSYISRDYNKLDEEYTIANNMVEKIGSCMALTEFNIKKVDKFAEITPINSKDYIKRIDIRARYNNADVNIKQLYDGINESLEMQKSLLAENDKNLFKNILINDISQKIVDKIKYAKEWIYKINSSIEEMDTSSGLALSIKWVAKKSENDEQMDIAELVGLLEKDKELIKDTDMERIINHFKAMVKRARILLKEKNEIQSYMGAMKNVLDYRQWYEFQLFYKKAGEKKKTLTDAEFFKFSGGEKAMSMYVPLFAAVSAKYDACNSEAPRIIALDEAFAGVDDKNIRDMFRLITDFRFGFIINSQSLWGDCDTLPSLSIYQLNRPSNRKYVSAIRYIWNGFRRENTNE